ncbi:Uncharacterised protein [Bordetella pertussis]|nr:Uncharacterised protein [Bordetella pertussis]
MTSGCSRSAWRICRNVQPSRKVIWRWLMSPRASRCSNCQGESPSMAW